ncbi:hypothetical protein BDF20DRAFT_661257 [Mycotypha africana]|uniref:uncharacterized protein n=1 Tax=Mycotypha africana TaxID=64632 RepID=UPI0022FFECA7|nr:uncharacterized protein BDF20DRAFT_661257 [Mycotypha africana]KAI8973602.1 hypothetical protein BDF20DRAFT_661257 [Mycotypha africana]
MKTYLFFVVKGCYGKYSSDDLRLTLNSPVSIAIPISNFHVSPSSMTPMGRHGAQHGHVNPNGYLHHNMAQGTERTALTMNEQPNMEGCCYLVSDLASHPMLKNEERWVVPENLDDHSCWGSAGEDLYTLKCPSWGQWTWFFFKKKQYLSSMGSPV